MGERHAFVTTLSCFHPRHFLCVFFVDRHKCLSSGVVVSVLTSSAVDRGFESSRVNPRNIKEKLKSKDWLAQNQNNVSKWSGMSICELLFQ